jgi:hypothetical protein
MYPRELVDHVRSGPAGELTLDYPLLFRPRTLFNRCDFKKFLQALQSSETIRTVPCKSHCLGITGDEWILPVKTIGIIKDIKDLRLWCGSGSHDFHPLQAAADAVNNTQSLCRLDVFLYLGTFPRDPSGLIAVANALREHTVVREFP